MKRVTEATVEDYSSIFATNFEGPYHLCQLAHPFLKESRAGSIVFVSSMAGVTALPALSIYGASKGNFSFNSIDCKAARNSDKFS